MSKKKKNQDEDSKKGAEIPPDVGIMRSVLGFVGLWSNRRIAELVFEHRLSKELALSPLDIRTMTGALRSYVQRFRADKTLTVAEVNKLEKVGPLAGGVITKITDRAIAEADLKELMKAAQTAPPSESRVEDELIV